MLSFDCFWKFLPLKYCRLTSIRSQAPPRKIPMNRSKAKIYEHYILKYLGTVYYYKSNYYTPGEVTQQLNTYTVLQRGPEFSAQHTHQKCSLVSYLHVLDIWWPLLTYAGICPPHHWNNKNIKHLIIFTSHSSPQAPSRSTPHLLRPSQLSVFCYCFLNNSRTLICTTHAHMGVGTNMIKKTLYGFL